jgi:hypothetical protein
MRISEVLDALKRRWYASLIVVVVAAGAAILLKGSLTGVPTGSATVQILVDSPVSSLVNLKADPASLEARASVLAQAMSSNVVVASIAKTAGVPAAALTAQGPYSGTGQSLNVPTPSEARSAQIVSVNSPYRLSFVAQQQIPIVTVSVTGPTPAAAGKVADAVLPGTNAWLDSLSTPDLVKADRVVHLRQLGDAQIGPVTSSSAKMIAGVGAVAVLMLGFLAIALFDARAASDRREPSEAELLFPDDLGPDGAHAEHAHGAPSVRLEGLPFGAVAVPAGVASSQGEPADEGNWTTIATDNGRSSPSRPARPVS